ncbi:MAG: Malonyl CoA-acyl carrier protein transacylase [Dehalococcoidia bacterium]|nr:Malonyl CoA-acyl carrier protein transacylase [Dehalococcoidia bacterium]
MNADTRHAGPDPRVAFLFPGQGSQAVGMGLELYKSSPAARAVFDEADRALGVPISRVIFEGPEDELRKTVNTQPAILTVSLACLKAMEEALGSARMPRPAMVAGHSLGEYTALAAAGALGMADAMRLVRERGRLMQYASELRPGGMAAIMGLDSLILEEVCRETDTQISNMNTADQIVISGSLEALEKAMALASARGARRTVSLVVGGAFHSRLMEPAREGMATILKGLTIHKPAIPVVANCTGRPMTSVAEVKEELNSGLCSCVRWKETVEHMTQSGITRFYEIGPGKVLTGLVKRINGEAEVANVDNAESIRLLAG